MQNLFHLLPPFLKALGVTLELLLGGAAVALVCAFAAGLGRMSRDPIVRVTATLYVEFFRGTSVLVQLFWFYFALPILLGISLPPMLVGILVLGLNVGSYGAEVVRAAIAAVPRSQYQAAVALNFSRSQIFRYIIVPQAIPAMLPPFGNLLIELLKSTTLVSMIEVTDITRFGIVLRDETMRTASIFGSLLVVYFLLAQLTALGMRSLERRFPPVQSRGA